MDVELTINRKFLHGSRPDYFYFMNNTVFPRTEVNKDYPDSGKTISPLRDLFSSYATAYGSKNTQLADETYQDILNATIPLIKYVEINCGNLVSKLEETGFRANKTTKTSAPVTGKVLNVNSMSLGEQKMKFEYQADEYADFFTARIRLKGGTDTDWVANGTSVTHVMILTSGLIHGKDYEIQICGNGTKGAGDWSDIKGFLVD